MNRLLITCGNVELLRKLVEDLPEGEFKPLASRAGGGVADTIAGRDDIAAALVYERLEDGPGLALCRQLQQLDDGPPVMYLCDEPPDEGPFDRAIRYPVPGPVLRHSLTKLTDDGETGQDLQKWKAFYREIKSRLENLPEQNYYEMLGLPRGAGHDRVTAAFDRLSLRYHPDRYKQYRDRKWGAAIHDKANVLYTALTEAYRVLTDRKMRRRYDEELDAGNLRLSDAEANKAERSGPTSLEEAARTTQGRKFLRMAQSDLAKDDLESALQNLKFAASMESDNRHIDDKIEEVERQLDA